MSCFIPPEDERAVPESIDTRHPYPEPVDPRTRAKQSDAQSLEYLGGLAWSKPFERYIRHVLPNAVRAERDEQRRQWREWWTVPYVVERLHRHLDPLDPDAVAAVVAFLAQPEPHPWRIARRYGKDARWLIQQKSRCVALVRRWYLPYKHPRRQAPDTNPQGVTPTSTRLETLVADTP